MLLGEKNTGKSTFITCLANQLMEGKDVYLLDCDLGQPNLGLAGGVYLQKFNKKITSNSSIQDCFETLKAFYIDEASPAGNKQLYINSVKALIQDFYLKVDS